MQDLNDFITGSTLTAAQFVEIPSEIQNVIEGLGLTLSSGDLNQLGKAIAGYVSNGTFYTDSGIADAYVLTKIGLKQTATAYTDGFLVSFLAGNVNAGASTVNVAGLGVKNIKISDGTDPAAGDIAGRVSLSFDVSNDRFVLLKPKVTNSPSFTFTLFSKAVASTNTDIIRVGGVLGIKDRGNSTWDLVPASSVTPNTFDIVVSTGIGTIALVLREIDGNVLRYGAISGATDNSAECIAAIAHVNRFLIPKGVITNALSVAVKDETFIRVEGVLRMPDSSGDWSSILTNQDTTNGNRGVTIDFTGGEFDGNRANQTGSIHHVPALFIECFDFDIFGGKYGKNFAPETAPSNHPLGPFDQGVPYGEASVLFPTVGMITFMGGRNNNIHHFSLIDWAQEGISPRWNEGSSVTNYRAINGPETNEPYYVPVDFGSRAGTVTLAANDTVLVQSNYFFGGVEQQPDLIYEFVGTPGSFDLGLEDYKGSNWDLVLRDITNDLGFTSARISGAKGQMNLIADAYAAFCRASSFSCDSEISGMANLHSYHNSFQVGINWGHANTPAGRGFATGLTAINSGWSGGVGGNSFGISIVGASDQVVINDYHISGAGRNGINISDSADRVKLGPGIVKFSAAGGIKSSSAQLDCYGVTSELNVGDDFEPTGTAVISLHGCRDSRGVLLDNERLISTARTGQQQQSLYGDLGKYRKLFRDSFATSAGVALVILTGTKTNSDNMIITVTYSERNSGSSAAGNQRACRTTFLISGSSTARTVQILDEPFQLNRKLRATWTIGTETLEVFLRDLVPADVAANNVNNSLMVEIQNHGYEYGAGLG